jgi:hypothetical protein
MTSRVYDWSSKRDLSDFLLEGSGELCMADGSQLLIRTYHLGPYRKATNVWLRRHPLPAAFRISWRYRSESPAGNSMIIFNATPVLLDDLFEDSRPEARYCDLASWRKLVAYTCGFHRGPNGNPSVLRKIGGDVPAQWGMLTWPGDAWKQCDQITRLHAAAEPLAPQDKGKWHDFVLERRGNRIQYAVNGALVHDVADTGQYPYHTSPLTGGHLSFRNFGGPADDYYADILVESLDP